MDRIDKRLLDRLQERLGLGQSTVYARIQKRARTEKLPIDLAAISLAADEGLSITKFASAEQLAALRGITPRPARAGNAEPNNPTRAARPVRPAKRERKRRPNGNRVFVVHGRNEKLRKGMFRFLRAAGVQPIEWSKAISFTRKASPHIGDILEAAFQKAQAVVVLMTPDDEAKLKDEYLKRGDPSHERKLTGQARPNVLFEAGMAFGTHPNQTVLVECGKLRPISDIVGRHAVRMDGSVGKRQELMIKLQNAGCKVDFVNSDWQNEGDLML